MDIINLIYPIFAGIISGGITALLGYAKSVSVESFDPSKAVQTIIVGAFVGGVAGYTGMTYEDANDWLISIGAITVVEYIKKAIWRKIRS